MVLPVRGRAFTKQVWLEKTASPQLSKSRNTLLRKIWQGKTTAPRWLDLVCDRDSCLYKKRIKIIKGEGVEADGRRLQTDGTDGMAIYLKQPLEIVTVREDIGRRFWNR